MRWGRACCGRSCRSRTRRARNCGRRLSILKDENTTLMKENLLLKDRVIFALSRAAASTKKAAVKDVTTAGRKVGQRGNDKEPVNVHVANNEGAHVGFDEELAGILRLLRQEVTWQSGQLAPSGPSHGTGTDLPESVSAPRGEYERTLRERLSNLMDEVSEKEAEAEEARARATRAERERDAFRTRLREQVEGQLSPPAARTHAEVQPNVEGWWGRVSNPKGLFQPTRRWGRRLNRPPFWALNGTRLPRSCKSKRIS